MFEHGPKCLEGPIIGSQNWWQELGDSCGAEAEERPATIPFPKHRVKGAPIRFELVDRVRRQIADGVYDTPERWEAALDRLFETL